MKTTTTTAPVSEYDSQAAAFLTRYAIRMAIKPAARNTPGPWAYSFTSAADAREDARREAKANGTTPTDGGGADGRIYAPGDSRYGSVTIAQAPHHRDPAEDAQRLANLRLMAAAPELLAALELCAKELAARDAVNAAVYARQGLPKPSDPALAIVTAAIAKATT